MSTAQVNELKTVDGTKSVQVADIVSIESLSGSSGGGIWECKKFSDGTLIWTGNIGVTTSSLSINVFGSTSGDVYFGEQEQSVSLLPFVGDYRVTASPSNATCILIKVLNKTENTIPFYLYSVIDGDDPYCNWIAIGRWK